MIPPMRLLSFSLLALILLGGVAFADRDRDYRRDRRDDRRDYRRDDRRGPVVRDHRDSRRYDRPRYDRGGYRHDRRVVRHRPVYVSNGRYVFNGGITRTYRRPVFHTRYYDYRVRPTIYVENYDPVPGYVWMQGSWRWNGGEWIWTSGYYAPDPQYNVYYDDGSYE